MFNLAGMRNAVASYRDSAANSLADTGWAGTDMERDKSHRGNASQFFVAGELCRRGYAALVTIGNTPNTDILCSNRAGTRFVHIQVKTFVPGTKSCSVGVKAERNFGDKFLWILAGIPGPKSPHAFEYFIVPSAAMSANVAAYHQQWLETPGKNDRPHMDNTVRAVAVAAGAPKYFWPVSEYRDRCDLIERELDA